MSKTNLKKWKCLQMDILKLINTIIEINTQTDVLKSRRGQRKKLRNQRTIELSKVRNKENTLKK